MTRQSRGASRLRARTARFISAAATLGLLGAGLAAPLAPLAQAVTPAHHPAAPLPERVRATGTPLLQEAFTGATADSRFIAVGSACLTGAAPARPGPGDHPLGGCPAAETGPVPPLDSAPLGYLRITDSGNDQSGAVLFDQALPAGNGLDVTFDQWQYGSTTPNTPADGISFFLVNGDVSLTHPGAFGGSLGYAQKLPDDNPNLGFLPGVDRGYLGVGLDVLGNYFGDWEQRGNGCPQRSPAGTSFRVPAPGANMVTVRGPGDGTTGYCFLTATTSNLTTNGPWPSTLPGKLQGPLTTLPAGVTPAEAQTLLEPSRRRVNVHLTPAPSPVLTVSVDFNDGTGSHQVLQTPAPEPVPSTYKFGFAGSTGLFTDVHLIRNVVIYTDQPLPELNLVKQPHEPLPGLLTVGTPIPYDFVVTNSGNVPITNLAVNDPTVGPVTCPVNTLAPGETVTCTATYLVTAADAAQGHVTNTAQATGTTDVGPVTSPPDTVTLPVVAPPGITLTKHVDAPEPFHVGDTVPYSYVVTNTGGSPVTALSVTDDKATGITCDSTVLAPAGSPGDSTVCHGTYVVTAADAQDGKVLNHATANGTSDGRPVTAEAQATVTVIGPSSISLAKQAGTPGPVHAGDTVTYTYTVTNTGTTTLTDVSVADDHVQNVTCDRTTLLAGQAATCHGTYTVTAADEQLGHVTNTAQADSTGPLGELVQSPIAQVTLPVAGVPKLALTKRADSAGPFHVGDTVAYTYTVTNSGTTVIDDLTVADDHVSSVSCDRTTLEPGQNTTCHGTYTVTAADAQAGHITNTAHANGTDPQGQPVQSPPAQATVDVVTPASALAVAKQADSAGPFHIGDTVHYTYTVTNTGNTTVNSITVSDDHVASVTCDQTTLEPGQNTTCHGTYTVTAADAQAGHVTNTAHANGTDPQGQPVQSPPAQATVDVVTPASALAVAKQADSAGPFHIGDTVHYTYTVTNTGNTTVNSITVSDDHVSSVTCDQTTLEPGQNTTCHGTYTVTAADAQAGHITNTAHANGTDPQGQPVQSPPVEATVDVVTPVSALTIAKQADSAGPFQVGDTVHYTYTVTNSGMTVINSIIVSDDHVSSVTCDQTTLTSGQSTTCHGTYTVTAADAQAGHVTNTAHADGTDPQGRPVQSAPVQATVTVGTATSSLAVTKRSDAAGTVYPGDTVTYTYTVTNTGSTTLTGLTVGDDRVRQVTCEQTTLDPGQSTTCHGTYTVTEADAQAGSVTNTAQASARDPQGQTVQSPPVELCISVAPCPPKGHDHKGGGGKGCPSRPGHHPIPPQKGGPGGELPSAGAPVAVVGLAGGGLVTLGGALFYRARRRAAAGQFVA